jgi:uncharacterized protein
MLRLSLLTSRAAATPSVAHASLRLALVRATDRVSLASASSSSAAAFVPPVSRPTTRARTTMATAAAAGDAPPTPPPPFHTLTYAYVPDILERRGPYRAAHIDAAKAAVAAGKMVLAGATGDPVSGALFVWAPTVLRAEIEAFAAGDPYVQAGLVTGWAVEPYMVVAQK